MALFSRPSPPPSDTVKITGSTLKKLNQALGRLPNKIGSTGADRTDIGQRAEAIKALLPEKAGNMPVNDALKILAGIAQIKHIYGDTAVTEALGKVLKTLTDTVAAVKNTTPENLNAALKAYVKTQGAQLGAPSQTAAPPPATPAPAAATPPMPPQAPPAAPPVQPGTAAPAQTRPMPPQAPPATASVQPGTPAAPVAPTASPTATHVYELSRKARQEFEAWTKLVENAVNRKQTSFTDYQKTTAQAIIKKINDILNNPDSKGGFFGGGKIRFPADRIVSLFAELEKLSIFGENQEDNFGEIYEKLGVTENVNREIKKIKEKMAKNEGVELSEIEERIRPAASVATVEPQFAGPAAAGLPPQPSLPAPEKSRSGCLRWIIGGGVVIAALAVFGAYVSADASTDIDPDDSADADNQPEIAGSIDTASPESEKSGPASGTLVVAFPGIPAKTLAATGLRGAFPAGMDTRAEADTAGSAAAAGVSPSFQITG